MARNAASSFLILCKHLMLVMAAIKCPSTSIAVVENHKKRRRTKKTCQYAFNPSISLEPRGEKKNIYQLQDKRDPRHQWVQIFFFPAVCFSFVFQLDLFVEENVPRKGSKWLLGVV